MGPPLDAALPHAMHAKSPAVESAKPRFTRIRVVSVRADAKNPPPRKGNMRRA
jgi:hypothetical protein